MPYRRRIGPGGPADAGGPARCSLTAGLEAPGLAREFVGDLLEDAPEELRARCTHVVSELVTNSVKHSGSATIVLQVWPDADGGVAVDVSDTGPGFDILPRAAGHDDPEGWGLMFVDMLSDAWGSGGEGSPAVWAQFEPRSIDDDDELPALDPVLDAPPPDLLDVRMLLDSVKDYAIFALDTNGAITLWNAGAERLTGYSADEVLGMGLAGMFDDDDAVDDDDSDLATALSHGRHEFQRWMGRKDGSHFWADCVLTPIFDGARVLRGFSSVARDVTWRKRLDEDREDLIERIRVLARTDDLTSLANRRRWHEELDHELARARRHRTTLCVAMVDMDGFKVFNDTNGHQAGDALLQQTSSAWGEALRTTDTLARYGGDEFSVILPDCPLDEALTVIERLRQYTPGPATCSAGVACSDGSEPAESLVRRADLALYEAKRSGRNATVAV
jgi:diguanylate cyclase (GGDEF)-like protein/PAS domain S-box-containing protein